MFKGEAVKEERGGKKRGNKSERDAGMGRMFVFGFFYWFVWGTFASSRPTGVSFLKNCLGFWEICFFFSCQELRNKKTDVTLTCIPLNTACFRRDFLFCFTKNMKQIYFWWQLHQAAQEVRHRFIIENPVNFQNKTPCADQSLMRHSTEIKRNHLTMRFMLQNGIKVHKVHLPASLKLTTLHVLFHLYKNQSALRKSLQDKSQ